MTTDTATESAFRPLAVTPPSTDPAAPLVMRLVRDFGAALVDETTAADWIALPGDRVMLLAGDAVRFPEGQDVAAVLPELMKAFPDRFEVAAVPRESEDALARRYGSQRWPSLLFFRSGQYVTAIAGMKDWDIYLQDVASALHMPPSRPPTIGIPVVSKSSLSADNAGGCH